MFFSLYRGFLFAPLLLAQYIEHTSCKGYVQHPQCWKPPSPPHHHHRSRWPVWDNSLWQILNKLGQNQSRPELKHWQSKLRFRGKESNCWRNPPCFILLYGTLAPLHETIWTNMKSTRKVNTKPIHLNQLEMWEPLFANALPESIFRICCLKPPNLGWGG